MARFGTFPELQNSTQMSLVSMMAFTVAERRGQYIALAQRRVRPGSGSRTIPAGRWPQRRRAAFGKVRLFEGRLFVRRQRLNEIDGRAIEA